jgi:hypothetical protein
MVDRIIEITSTLYNDDDYWVYCIEHNNISSVVMDLINREMSISFPPEEWGNFTDNLKDVAMPSDVIISPNNPISLFMESPYSVWVDVSDNGEYTITLIFHNHRGCTLLFNEEEWKAFTDMLANSNEIPRAFKIIQGGIIKDETGFASS